MLERIYDTPCGQIHYWVSKTAAHPAPQRTPDYGIRQPAPKTDAQLASEAEKKIFLRLERKDMERAGAVLALHAGNVAVYMHLPAEKMTLLCPRENWCSADEDCLRRLKNELGAENVVLKQKG